MSNFDYNTPIITALRAGSAEDPYVDKTDTLQIDINSKVVLTEIPVKLNRVQVTGQNVTWIEIQSGSPTANQYIVDYTNKIVTFHESRKGLQLTFTYKGRGLIYVPTSMIYTNSVDGTVTQTLDQVVEAASNFVHRGEYDPLVIYRTYNLVSYLGLTYIYVASASSTGNAPDASNSSYWIKVAGYANRGIYATSTSYNIGDVVTDSNYHNIYQSKVNSNLNQSLTNTSKWQLLISVQSTVDILNTTNTNVTNAESLRVTSESGRASAESTRISQESSRVSSESMRESRESIRVSQETTRQSNESTRSNQENTRQASYIAYKLLEPYDAGHSYVPLNKVIFNGSTYQCILASTGNAPSDTTYWIKIAAKGENGAGTVASVSSTNGDIVIGGTEFNPTLTLNSGTGANQIVKRNANSAIETNSIVLGTFKIQYNSTNNTLDFIFG